MNRKHKQKHRPFIQTVLLFSLMELAHYIVNPDHAPHLLLNPPL